MRITLTGTTGGRDFLEFAFYSDAETQILSSTPTALTLRNPETGAVTTFTGTGLGVSPNGTGFTGTITGWTTLNASGMQVTSVTGIVWTFAEAAEAIRQAFDFDNEGPLSALFSRQDITIDAGGYQQFTELFADGITSNVTFVASAVGGRYEGGTGNDVFRFAPPQSGSNSILLASSGNDTYDFTNASSSAGGNYTLAYHTLTAPVTANINAMTNTGTITSAVGTDTLINIRNVLADDGAGGFSLVGSVGADTFNITTSSESFMVVAGGRGNDTYNLTLNGILRLSFAGDGNGNATMGARVNLATGVVANDGFGFRDTINVIGTNGRLEIEGTRFNDIITGSDRSESFILGGGNDTLDGGGGFDRVRFDRAQMTSGVVVDLTAGTATGQWQGTAFAHQISNIEWVRGTSTFNDVLIGSNDANRLESRGGNNLFDARGGDDTINGGTGNDTVYAGAGDDYIDLRAGGNNLAFGGAGDDRLIGGAGNDTLGGGGGNDLIDARAGGRNDLWAGAGDDTVYGGNEGDMIGAGAGNDLIFAGNGNNEIYGGFGNDTINGGSGDDTIYGGPGNDVINGGAGDDVISAGAGFDVLTGGAGADTFVFYRNFNWNNITDFNTAEGDTLALARWMWSSQGILTAQQVVDQFASINAAGNVVLDFGPGNTQIQLLGYSDLAGLAGHIDIIV